MNVVGLRPMAGATRVNPLASPRAVRLEPRKPEDDEAKRHDGTRGGVTPRRKGRTQAPTAEERDTFERLLDTYL